MQCVRSVQGSYIGVNPLCVLSLHHAHSCFLAGLTAFDDMFFWGFFLNQFVALNYGVIDIFPGLLSVTLVRMAYIHYLYPVNVTYSKLCK